MYLWLIRQRMILGGSGRQNKFGMIKRPSSSLQYGGRRLTDRRQFTQNQRYTQYPQFKGLISFTRFTDYGAYFSLPLPFSVYLGIAVAALGILLCIFVGIANGIRRCFTRGKMPMPTDDFSSTRHIMDVEMTYSHSTKHKQFSQRPGNLSIRDERSSHGYADIDDLDPDDYENVKERLSDTDSDDYENLRSGI
uniref:Uncharacterized protein n=1 Tax=Magallana gigas TaxID=29159 RepID=K1Q424_MAGGI